MSEHHVKGWCPGAFRPMLSGDGLLVRIKPAMARLTREQMTAICTLAETYGNGIIDVTRRANLQIRGVRERDHQTVLADLASAGLLDKTPEMDRRRNILIQPFWTPGDLTYRLAHALIDALPDFPELPAKAGYAIDCGGSRRLTEASADIRFECGPEGLVIVRADGQENGCAVPESDAIATARTLAEWYAENVSPSQRRLHKITASHPLPAQWRKKPPATGSAAPPKPGNTENGTLLAVPFGQLRAPMLRAVSERAVVAIRLTPWRMVLIEGAPDMRVPGLIADPSDPLLRVDACPGAPRCASAHCDTHRLARRLASQVRGQLHVSGCGKGCARDAPADLTIVGQKDGFDIIRNGNAQTPPERTKVAESELIAGSI